MQLTKLNSNYFNIDDPLNDPLNYSTLSFPPRLVVVAPFSTIHYELHQTNPSNLIESHIEEFASFLQIAENRRRY
jgi:hypothetical protein